MNIKPIRTETDYEQALAKVDKIFQAPPGTPKGDKLEVLVTLIEAYETKRHPIEPPDPIEAIKHRMDALGLTRKDLEPMIGGRSRISEIFARKRPLTLPMIRKLHEGLGIPLEALVQDYEIA